MCQSIFLGWSLMGCLYFLHRKHIFFFLYPPWILLAVLSYRLCLVQALIQPCLHGGAVLPPRHIPTIFHCETRLELKSRLEYELLHSALQPTFSTDNKGLFFCITFLPLWPNLASLQCIFTAYIYYFCTIPLRSDMAHPSRKSPTLTLWKSLQIELSQQFPASLSWQNVFIAVQGSSVPVDLCVIREFDRQARRRPHVCAPTHIHERTLWWEAGGQLWATVTGNGCREVSVPPGRQCTQHSACMSTDSDRNLMIPRCEKQRHNGTLKMLWRICWRCFLSRHNNQIILYCAALCLPTYSLCLLR